MRLTISVASIVLITGLTARGGTPPNNPAPAEVWNWQGAARYLDERIDIWFANADKLRTGEAKTACVSCHTTVPYLMARPALRRAMQVGTATPQETKLLEETRERVQTYSTHQLLYEFSDGKKLESRGTEAVLNALVLATADSTQNRQEPSTPTRLALEQLRETQRADGAWDWLNFGLEPFESIDARYHGATLAALAIGLAHSSADAHASEARACRQTARLSEGQLSLATPFQSGLAAAGFHTFEWFADRSATRSFGYKDSKMPTRGWRMVDA